MDDKGETTMTEEESPLMDEEVTPLLFSAHDAAAVLELLWQRGYLHDTHAPASLLDQSDTDPSVASSYDKKESWLLQTLGDKSYVTLSHVRDKLGTFLVEKGTCTLKEGAEELDVTIQDLTCRIMPLAWMEAQHSDWIRLENDRILTLAYLEEVASKVVAWLAEENGSVPVTMVAQRWVWSVEETRRFLTHRLAKLAGVEELRDDRGAFVYVTPQYRESFQASVRQALATSRDIVHLPTLCVERDWPAVWVFALVKQEIGSLPGILRKDDFVPDAYRQRQEDIVLEHYSRDGYITSATKLDLLSRQVQALVLSNFPSTAIVLPDCVLNYDRVGVPLEALLAEAAASETFVELRPPVDLLNFVDTVRILLTDHVLPKMQLATNDGSCLAITMERVLFVSHRMMLQIRTDLLPRVVDPCVQALARKAYDAKAAVDMADIVREIPVTMLVDALVEDFPPLQVLEHDGSDGILAIFVEEHLLTEDWMESWLEAARVELVRLEAAETAKLTGLVPNAHSSAVEVALEDPSCFPAACYVIQLQNKFLEYAVKLGMEVAEVRVLEHEILEGCCRDLVRRLTLYLLDKYEVEDMVSFVMDPPALIPVSYGIPVDTALRQYPTVRVEGALDENGKEWNLAKALTDRVPIQICKALAELEEAGMVEDFIHAAEENCLSICGIPFRKLDKKAEKVFLTHRRQRLVALLEASQVPGDILDYTIMILYQSVKQQTVAGSLLRGPILRHLVKERKISEAVGRLLTKMAESLDASDEGLVERVRSCGFAKDIAKHVVA
jgi:hypothetical protein